MDGAADLLAASRKRYIVDLETSGLAGATFITVEDVMSQPLRCGCAPWPYCGWLENAPPRHVDLKQRELGDRLYSDYSSSENLC